jgi:hypothetical protein
MALLLLELKPIPPITFTWSFCAEIASTVPPEPSSVSGGKGVPPSGKPPLAEFQKRGAADRLYW